MENDDDLFLEMTALGINPWDHKPSDWETAMREAVKNARRAHPNAVPHPAPPFTSKTKAAPVPVAPAPAPSPPILMRATMRVHFSKFTPDFLPRETIHAMMRNQVVPSLPSEIPARMLEWCEKNCSDLWMPSPPARPEYIMFASNDDMILFLTAFGGG